MIEVINLTKKFGDIIAINDLSFRIEKGEIFGLLGENGAGKTTTLRILATMLKPTSGSAVLGDYDILRQPSMVRQNLGILFGGESGLYDRLTTRENILYFAELNDMEKKTAVKRMEKLIGFFGMEEYADRRASGLSKGMKQKTAFARSIIHNPDIMLFDEPTSGLDVTAAREVHEFIAICRKEYKTVIFSSHSMSEVEKLCDRVGIIHKGKLVETGTSEQLKAKHRKDNLEELFVSLTGGDTK